MTKYNPKNIESKWQKYWQAHKTFLASNKSKKPKKYVLFEFPYPSGVGLHVGHMRPYIATDVYARYMRMTGHEVMYPMGWDAFGLPAENFAIKTGVQPAISTAANIKNAKRQVQSWGLSLDWSREINTTDPEYYKWTQWLFLQFLKAGLAYEATGVINWCPKDKTGLANEEVIAGKCERCGTEVEQKELRQWYLKITAYAEKLLQGLEKDLPLWPEQVKLQQENWIGKSEGAEIDFNLKFKNPADNKRRGPDGKPAHIKVYTTRPDTIFGATYLVLAPEHPWVTLAIDGSHNVLENKAAVKKYVESVKLKTEIERTNVEKEKTGVEIKGVKAINPANGEEIPLYVADYVLAGYGTGAIMAVPAHDERDYAFARKFKLPIKQVVMPAVVDNSNPPRASKKNTEREIILAIVRDPKTKSYLCLKWKSQPWTSFITGGIEDGEEATTAAVREIKEETGYTDVRLVQELGHTQSQFFATHKDLNRKVHARSFLFELVSSKRAKVSEEEQDLYDTVWIPESKITSIGVQHAEFDLLHEQIKTKGTAMSGDGILIHSGKYDGMTAEEARSKMAHAFGKPKVQYKLRDWVFSRQRYWGEPIPVIHCEKCGIVPVPDKDLPVLLPKVKKYEPTGTGESPLAAIDSWVNVKCPKCKSPAKRETNTMPQWAGSSWYYLRYTDPKNTKAFASKEALKYWTPVDTYFGGIEHTTLHLLYSRFWHQFFYDQKLVPTQEPYTRRVPHGIIVAHDGEKMSKSKGNVVNPDDIIKIYGTDTLRMYEMFLGPYESQTAWNDKGVIGVRRFLERVWALGENVAKLKGKVASSDKVEIALHKLIKKVGEDIEHFRFNTAVSSFMQFVNDIKDERVSKSSMVTFAQVLYPYAPHVAEELHAMLGGKNSVQLASWPKFDQSKLVESTVEVVVQINGKVRDKFAIAADASEKDIEAYALASDKIKTALAGTKPKRVIVIKNKLVNIVA